MFKIELIHKLIQQHEIVFNKSMYLVYKMTKWFVKSALVAFSTNWKFKLLYKEHNYNG